MDYLTTQQAADELGISVRAVQTRIKSGLLKAEKAGRDYMIARADLEASRGVKRGRKPGKLS